MTHKLLIIDDEKNIRFSIANVFADTDIQIQAAEDGVQGLQAVINTDPDVILLDLRLGQDSGLDVLQHIRAADPSALVILMTGYGTSDVAIEAMKHGAFDYIVKPLDVDQLRELVGQAIEIRRLAHVPALANTADQPESQPQLIVGSGPLMRTVCKQIGRIAPQNVNVLILGESGTGKELVARAIYHHSRRHDGPFLAINCAAIPETLLESELFGHEKGAFTGAHQRRIGKFEQCHQGTLLLDEIGDMSPATQAKLLRLLQEGRFERVGGNESIRVDVRIIAATNRDLESLIQQGKFRLDLLYRLRGVTITLPPLRQRAEDIAELAHHFLFRYRAETASCVQSISPDALEILTNYSWPGNVRELQNVIRGALIAATGASLIPAFLPPELFVEAAADDEECLPAPDDDVSSWQSLPSRVDRWLMENHNDIYRHALEEFDRFLIGRAMRHTGDNQARAASLLGLSRITVRNKLRALMPSTDPKDLTDRSLPQG